MSGSVVFLLGAGFSAPFGVPTMGPFLHSFKDIARKKYVRLVGTLERHFEGLREDDDLEALLSSLNRAERVTDGLPSGSNVPAEFEKWQEDSRHLKAHLISYIIERCELFDRSRSIEALGRGFEELYSSRRLENVHFFTTNYDRIVEYVLEQRGINFSDGFDDDEGELVVPWSRRFSSKVRVYKLHGSVSYYVDRSEIAPSFMRLDRGYPLPGPDFRLSRGGHELEPLMVLPALEKDSLGEPYIHLSHLFSDRVADNKLVVAIGSSLRDSHVLGALTYNSESTIVLVVDSEPESVRDRIPGVDVVQIRGDSAGFFENSIGRLIGLVAECEGSGEKGRLLLKVREFARRETELAASRSPLTDDQEEAISCIWGSQSTGEILMAIRELYGVADERVIDALRTKLNESADLDVRKAVTGCLGTLGEGQSVGMLANIAVEDVAAPVRLEAYLALQNIGNKDALVALESARERWANDSYFEA